MSDVYAMSFNTPNYSGLIGIKGNNETPLLSAIRPNAKTTNHVEFAVGQFYEVGGGSQPEISELASLTAPEATVTARTQQTNVTQIFQESFGISDAKLSNMGTLQGINYANQTAPASEYDIQLNAKMQKISKDIEYVLINGQYQKATSDSVANKTRGLVPAITSNVSDNNGKPLGIWNIAELMQSIYSNGAPTNGLCLWCDATTLLQLNADAQNNHLTIVPDSRTVNGISLQSVITPLGIINLRLGEYLPSGTALLLNLGVISPVFQLVPNKGTFYVEELAKTGAGSKYQIFGQLGLDYCHEWYHGKITGISTEFKAPEGRKVVVVNPVGTIATANNLIEATIDKTTVEAADTNKVTVVSTTPTVTPAEAPTLAYLWQIRAKTGTTWTDLTNSYTGYNTAELTIKAADLDKHYRCKVTASGSVTGTVYTDECTVVSAST